jgi:hypothetical protein
VRRAAYRHLLSLIAAAQTRVWITNAFVRAQFVSLVSPAHPLLQLRCAQRLPRSRPLRCGGARCGRAGAHTQRQRRARHAVGECPFSRAFCWICCAAASWWLLIIPVVKVAACYADRLLNAGARVFACVHALILNSSSILYHKCSVPCALCLRLISPRFRYQGRVLHAKTMLVDHLALVGSHNLNYRHV